MNEGRGQRRSSAGNTKIPSFPRPGVVYSSGTAASQLCDLSQVPCAFVFLSYHGEPAHAQWQLLQQFHPILRDLSHNLFSQKHCLHRPVQGHPTCSASPRGRDHRLSQISPTGKDLRVSVVKRKMEVTRGEREQLRGPP